MKIVHLKLPTDTVKNQEIGDYLVNAPGTSHEQIIGKVTKKSVEGFWTHMDVDVMDRGKPPEES